MVSKSNSRQTTAGVTNKEPLESPDFCLIPQNDYRWAKSQKPSVAELFADCWLCDPYGSRWMPLATELKRTVFKAAKKQLSDKGLFIFKPEISIRDGRSTVCWLVRNLHGSRVKEFWKEVANPTLEAANPTLEVANPTLEVANPTLEVANPTSILPENLIQQGFQNASISPQYRLNNASITPHGVIEAVVASIPSEETEHPLRGAPTNDGIPEGETPQRATDCTSASSVIENKIESSPSLTDQTEAAGGELRDLGEDQSSAAAPPDTSSASEKIRNEIREKLGIGKKPPLKIDPEKAAQIAAQKEQVKWIASDTSLRYTLCRCQNCNREWADSFPSKQCDCGSREIQHRDLEALINQAQHPTVAPTLEDAPTVAPTLEDVLTPEKIVRPLTQVETMYLDILASVAPDSQPSKNHTHNHTHNF